MNDFAKSLTNAGVKASYDATNHRFFISSAKTGKENDFSLTAGNANGMKALEAFGLNAKSAANTANYEEFAAYALNTDGSQYFIKNSDGTYSTNGTYDAEKTKNNIDTIRKNVGDMSTQNTNLTADIAYANAYKGVEDVKKTFESSSEAGNWDLFTKLINRSDSSSIYVDEKGTAYKVSEEKDEDGNITYKATYTVTTQDADGNDIEEEKTVDLTKDGDTRYIFQDENGSDVTITHGAIRLAELETAAGLATVNVSDSGAKEYVVDSGKVSAFKNNLSVKGKFEADTTNNAATMQAVKDAYADSDTTKLDTLVKSWETTVKDNKDYIETHKLISNDVDTPESLEGKVSAAVQALKNPSYNTEAVRVDGTDAEIVLNGATFTSATNQFEINGMSISALNTTNGQITITTDDDVTGLYDKIKEFVTGYSSLMNEMTSLFNAESAKGYEPLTDEEKEAMSDAEVEKWEEKIKKSLLRRDDTLDSIISSMQNAMAKSYEVNGKKYSFSNFGIVTLGIFDSAANQQNAYHINGDEDDAATSSKDKKLMSMLKSDPDTVIEFMRQAVNGLYSAIDKKMGSNQMSSKYVVYNDKEMASEYSDYTSTISKWEEKLTDLEDYYYKKFSAMETALAKLQSQQSSMTGLFGS